MRYRLTRLAWLAMALTLAVGRPSAASDSTIADAAERRAVAALRALVQQGADVNAPQPDGATAVHWAAHWDDVVIASELLRAGADPNAANDYGVTPLLLAAENGSAEMVAALLQGRRTSQCRPSNWSDGPHDGRTDRQGRSRGGASVGWCRR